MGIKDMKLIPILLTLLLSFNAAAGTHRGHGSTHRDRNQVHHFRAAHPCPATGRTRGACPGYVIDHVRALCAGGADSPGNMQWQTVLDAKSKDKWECKR